MLKTFLQSWDKKVAFHEIFYSMKHVSVGRVIYSARHGPLNTCRRRDFWLPSTAVEPDINKGVFRHQLQGHVVDSYLRNNFFDILFCINYENYKENMF